MEEQLVGELPLTQFGRACQKLGIEVITASSPQAKGRVERRHGVYQDRWAKELRLAGIRDIEGANQSLRGFTESLNARFTVEPRSSADFHRPVPQDMDLRSVFCREEQRTVGNDSSCALQEPLLPDRASVQLSTSQKKGHGARAFGWDNPHGLQR